MEYINELTANQVETQIREGDIPLIDAMRISTTPKEWVIITPDKTYCTGNPERVIKYIVTSEYPGIKASEVKLINTKKYRNNESK